MPGPVPSPPLPTGPGSRRVAWLVAALLLIHYVLAVGGKFTASTTSDELAHLTAGFSHWANHDYRLHPENGILPQRWAALPAWLRGTRFAPLADNPYWRGSDVWVVGHQFFYETGDDHFPRLMAGRAMIGLFSVATGLLIFFWSRRYFGEAGALVSLGFFVFCTDFLAHGALVTSDACMAFFLLAATGAWWWHLHDGRWRVWCCSAVTMGLAFTAKFSAPLLLPIMVVTAAVRAANNAPLALLGREFQRPATKFLAAALSAAGHAVVVVAVIWAAYGFRYSAFNPDLPPADQFIRTWEYMEGEIGLAGRWIHAARMAELLPESYLYGFAYVLQTVGLRSAFLNGDYSLTGWPTFFLWTFGMKTSAAVLLAAATALCLAALQVFRRRGARAWLYRLTPLLALFGIYWLTSVTSRLNIGHRHILPIYPVLFIFLGALGAWAVRRRGAALVLTGLLLGWHAVDTARIAPHYLAYFNALAGGPENGWRRLVDSSLDWGQDLPGLKAWLDDHARGEPVFLSYFGTGEPAYYGINAHRLPFANNFRFPVIFTPLEPGVYCVSATMLQHVYSAVRGATWTVELEKEFQALRAVEAGFDRYTREDAARAELERDVPRSRWQQAIGRYDVLRFARLCHYLRLRAPDAHVGYSIFIYRLDAREVRAAAGGTLAEWEQVIAETVNAR